MAAPNRSSSPGRTPPFVLVGLMVLVCFLAYNYWSLSSQNAELMAELDTVRVQGREVKDENTQFKETVESLRSELGTAKQQAEAFKSQASAKQGELDQLKKECSEKGAEVESCKKELAACEENLKTEQAAKQSVQGEKDAVAKELETLKAAPKVCEKADCEGPIKEVVVISAKLTGSEALGNALSGAGFDSAKLMEGINIPPPQAAAAAPAAQAQPAAAAPAEG